MTLLPLSVFSDEFGTELTTTSGVFQMKWMEPTLANGELAGKIVCPNKKCGAKIGNFDWAGVCCGCKEWVTPVRTHALFPCVC
jgi:hypothetical protein